MIDTCEMHIVWTDLGVGAQGSKVVLVEMEVWVKGMEL